MNIKNIFHHTTQHMYCVGVGYLAQVFMYVHQNFCWLSYELSPQTLCDIFMNTFKKHYLFFCSFNIYQFLGYIY